MSYHDWTVEHACCLGMGLPGDQIEETDGRGERITGDTFAILFNTFHEPISFRLGARQLEIRWKCLFDTALPNDTERIYEHMSYFPLQARSLAVLRGEIISTITNP
jgi:glycogen operon protein